MFPAICRDRLPRHHAGGGAHHIRMESTLMIYKSKFINTSRCGAGFPWLLAHPTPTCILGHPQLHGPAAGMDIYIPLRYWNTSTWVPYSGVHLHVHPDTYTRISTRTMALWRQLGAVTMALADPCSTAGRIYTTGCSTPRTWSSIGNLRTSLAALATDGMWHWPTTGPTGCSGYSVFPAGVRILHR